MISMKLHKAFTLIEMMVAVTLFSMVTLFLTSTLESQRVNYVIIKNKTDQEQKLVDLVELLKADVQQSSSLRIIQGDASVSLELRTVSSLYNMAAPFVKWFVNPKTKELIRSESASNFLPPFSSDELSFVHLDLVSKNAKWFKVFNSKKSDSVFIGLKISQRALFLEVLTPQHKK